MARSDRMAARLYRGLLHVYPRAFRQRYGTAMLELFRLGMNERGVPVVCLLASGFGPRSSATS